MLNSIIGSSLSVSAFLILTAVSLVLGIGTALISMYKSTCSKSFALALAILPAVVQLVIMLVNGNIGAGVAIAGAFSLVRFRSTPGTAKEIAIVFLSMAIGLATGMGYILLAVLFFFIIGGILLLLTALPFGDANSRERILKITIPENLDYDGLFDDIFKKYLTKNQLDKVKTVSMGTLYELHYRVTLKEAPVQKQFLDELRCRNGNLNIVCCRESERDLL